MCPLPTLFCVLEVLVLFGHFKISTSKMHHNVQKNMMADLFLILPRVYKKFENHSSKAYFF